MHTIIIRPDCVLSQCTHSHKSIAGVCRETAREHTYYWRDFNRFERELLKAFAKMRKLQLNRAITNTQWRGKVLLIRE